MPSKPDAKRVWRRAWMGSSPSLSIPPISMPCLQRYIPKQYSRQSDRFLCSVAACFTGVVVSKFAPLPISASWRTSKPKRHQNQSVASALRFRNSLGADIGVMRISESGTGGMSKSKSTKDLPYRPCVGAMVLNRQGQVFVGKRIDQTLEAWQMPQGGIDKGESPRDACFRELEEEVGTRHADIIREH